MKKFCQRGIVLISVLDPVRLAENTNMGVESISREGEDSRSSASAHGAFAVALAVSDGRFRPLVQWCWENKPQFSSSLYSLSDSHGQHR